MVRCNVTVTDSLRHNTYYTNQIRETGCKRQRGITKKALKINEKL